LNDEKSLKLRTGFERRDYTIGYHFSDSEPLVDRNGVLIGNGFTSDLKFEGREDLLLLGLSYLPTVQKRDQSSEKSLSLNLDLRYPLDQEAESSDFDWFHTKTEGSLLVGETYSDYDFERIVDLDFYLLVPAHKGGRLNVDILGGAHYTDRSSFEDRNLRGVNAAGLRSTEAQFFDSQSGSTLDYSHKQVELYLGPKLGLDALGGRISISPKAGYLRVEDRDRRDDLARITKGEANFVQFSCEVDYSLNLDDSKYFRELKIPFTKITPLKCSKLSVGWRKYFEPLTLSSDVTHYWNDDRTSDFIDEGHYSESESFTLGFEKSF